MGKARYIEKIRKLFALASNNPSEEEAAAAAMTFSYLYRQGSRLAKRAEREHRGVYGFARGVYNSFVIGFTDGVASELQAQSQELMVMESEIVRQGFEEYKREMGMVTVKCRRMRIGSRRRRRRGSALGAMRSAPGA